jgi:hypothetical protein
MLQRLAMFVMLAISFWISIANNDRLAFACVCLPMKSPYEELFRSTAVFAGKVTNIEDSGRIVTFDVDRVWKGISNEPVTVAIDLHCGSALEMGEEYLIYADSDHDGSLIANGCGRTMLLDSADAELAALGWSYPNPFLLVGIAAGVVGAITAGILITRRRRK